MKYKRTLPKDVRDLCCAHARGYERRLRELGARRGEAYERGRPEAGALQLDAIAASADEHSVEAVEQALLIACVGIRSTEVRRRLREGIMLNLANRKKYPFERLYIPGISKKEFYRRKNDFIFELASILGFDEK